MKPILIFSLFLVQICSSKLKTIKINNFSTRPYLIFPENLPSNSNTTHYSEFQILMLKLKMNRFQAKEVNTI